MNVFIYIHWNSLVSCNWLEFDNNMITCLIYDNQFFMLIFVFYFCFLMFYAFYFRLKS